MDSVGALAGILLKTWCEKKRYTTLLSLWWRRDMFRTGRTSWGLHHAEHISSTCTLDGFEQNFLPVEAESCRFPTSLLLDESWQCSPEDPEIPPMMARRLDTLEEVQTLPLPLPWEQQQRQNKWINYMTQTAGLQHPRKPLEFWIKLWDILSALHLTS